MGGGRRTQQASKHASQQASKPPIQKQNRHQRFSCVCMDIFFVKYMFLFCFMAYAISFFVFFNFAWLGSGLCFAWVARGRHSKQASKQASKQVSHRWAAGHCLFIHYCRYCIVCIIFLFRQNWVGGLVLFCSLACS
jgi:hypothetical protein